LEVVFVVLARRGVVQLDTQVRLSRPELELPLPFIVRF
jgi:hypothetical protein